MNRKGTPPPRYALIHFLLEKFRSLKKTAIEISSPKGTFLPI